MPQKCYEVGKDLGFIVCTSWFLRLKKANHPKGWDAKPLA